MSFNLGFIGGGNMSTAILKGILKSDSSKSATHSQNHIWVSGPHLESLKHWKDLGTNVTTKNGEVFDCCDVVFLGVKPGMLTDAVRGCLDTLTKGRNQKNILIISMLAGISIARLHKALEVLTPYANINVIRIMPNTPITVGAGTCLYTPDDNVTDADCLLLEKLFINSAICEKTSESMMESLGSLVGCGPAFMYLVIEALADGAVKLGVPRSTAIKFAAQMLVGSGQMVLQTGKHPGLLKDEVCSPGGSTICGVTALENGRLRATMISALEAASIRTKELGKN